jgi:hypothetical protein
MLSLQVDANESCRRHIALPPASAGRRAPYQSHEEEHNLTDSYRQAMLQIG